MNKTHDCQRPPDAAEYMGRVGEGELPKIITHNGLLYLEGGPTFSVPIIMCPWCGATVNDVEKEPAKKEEA